MIARARSCTLMLAIILAALVPFVARADVIDNFAVEIHVRADASVAVIEHIFYDFGVEEHHGIYRDIPAAYIDAGGNKQALTISDIAVLDGAASPIPFESFKNGDDMRLKIGDADVLVTGKRVYEISYVVHDAILFFEDHDELYWNVTGNEWLFPIRESSARVYTPASTTRATCYVGSRGSTELCGTMQVIAEDGSAWLFETGRALDVEQGLTVAVGWQKGVITEPTAAALFWRHIIALSPLLIPVIVLVFMFDRWWRYGRDERGRGTIIPEYDAPKEVTPALASAIVHQWVTTASVSATLIELAVRGYLKIHRDEDRTLGVFKTVKYRFDKIKPADEALSFDQAQVYAALFTGQDSVWSDDENIGTALVSARSAISKDATSKLVSLGYYRANPTVVKGVYISIAIVAGVIGIILAGATESAWVFVSALMSAILIGLFGLIMPARTKKGALAREQILGLKEYLQIAEKNRLDFHHAPEKSPELFEKLLPYAIMLGVSAAWAKEFEGLYEKPPKWYDGGAYAAFTPVAFASDMESLSTTVSALATPASSGGGSSGGGFSGGGVGGGGGGSW